MTGKNKTITESVIDDLLKSVEEHDKIAKERNKDNFKRALDY